MITIIAVTITAIICFVIGISIGSVTAENKFLKDREEDRRQRELAQAFDDNKPLN